ncbi:nickel pincer cofactor biosynthesis protein LarC [uncultured Tessaracoccus sp.]|uniref:nickel pincer cofactor biosynthesis protein LarC n=1 Tax=uncultured Tessaracoccus sp. TaxID=905023 RepID=UPI0025CF55B0|nr:nickel pincer cofactor biosynthesis protein LarC [uncultured Tessaracoccus sp.]
MHDHHPTAGLPTADGGRAAPGEPLRPGRVLPAGRDPRRVLWIDAREGAAGDMLLGALLDAGADAGSVAAVLELVAPGLLHLQRRTVTRGAFRATKVDVLADEPDPPARHLADVEAMLAADGVPAPTRAVALDAFRRLAVAEGAVHGMPPEEVHFHEVGALDSIGDVVGVAEALRTLGVAEVRCSTVALGQGEVRTQHGLLAVPPPAVLELARGFEVETGGPPEAGELCTPTGLALLRAMCAGQGAMPRMRVERIGIGAGTRVRADRAGVVRAVLGHPTTPPDAGHHHTEGLREVAANVDDLDPRLWPAVIDRLLDAGALDAWLTPVVMKRGRPAHQLTALVDEGAVEAVTDAVLAHTSTLGVRVTAPLHRRTLARTWVPVDVDGIAVRIKVSGDGPGHPIQQATAEFVDVARLAEARGEAQRIALARAQSAAWATGLRPGAPWPEGARDA